MLLDTSTLPPELVPYAQDLEEFRRETGIRLLLPPLGSGGGGTVLKAENLHGKHLAVKVIVAEDLASKDQALREANILKQVQHAKAFGGGDGLLWQKHHALVDLFFLAMDFIPGKTLTELITSKGPLNELIAIELAIGAAQELEALHQRNIIHRDVKPDNIMLLQLGRRYQPVVVDYGIAKVGNNRTWRGARAATDGYAPPEQYTGGTDRRTDIYALGATLYEMVTGQTPLASTNRDPHGMLEPRQYNPRISLDLERVIQVATAYHPWQRFPTMGALIDALRLVEDGKSLALWSMLQALRLLEDRKAVPPLPPLPTKRPTAASKARGLVCPHCQEPYQAGEAFCATCGAALDVTVQAALAAAPVPRTPEAVDILTPRTPNPQLLSLLFAHQIILGGPALSWLGKTLLVLAYWLELSSIALFAHTLSVVCALAGWIPVTCLVGYFLLIPVFVQILRHWDETKIMRRGQAHWLRRSALLLLSMAGLAGMLYWLMYEVAIWRTAWIPTSPPISLPIYLGIACFASLLIRTLLD